MSPLWHAFLPELQQFPANERELALRKAGDQELDLLELLAMGAGLVLVTALTGRLVAALAPGSAFWSSLAHFAVALPLLALALGPFHLRRLRRGLREQLRRRTAA